MRSALPLLLVLLALACRSKERTAAALPEVRYYEIADT
jgi:hypothetical protein